MAQQGQRTGRYRQRLVARHKSDHAIWRICGTNFVLVMRAT